MRLLPVLLFWLFLCLPAAAKNKVEVLRIASPDGQIEVSFKLQAGVPFYEVSRRRAVVVRDSRLGLNLKDRPGLEKNFAITASSTNTFDETWVQPWGEEKIIRNQYNQLLVTLEEQRRPRRKLILEFRVYNDGLGFRYEIPKQPNLDSFVVQDELTEFSLTHDFTTWWIPAYGDQMDCEYLYRKTQLSKLSEKVCTPLTMELNDSLFVSIHEAALVDYAGMGLAHIGHKQLKCDLYPWSNGNKVEGNTPLKSPWRTIQMASSAGDLVTSYLILNLNEPNKLDDISYVKPGKYAGIWWGMHLNRQTWEGGPNHGATTYNVKQLIDFASKHKLNAVLAEGWNEGWEGDWVTDGNFSFTNAYPDFDWAELSHYAKAKNVELIAHHETGGNIVNYENQLDAAFKLLEHYGIHTVKTGYVNKLPNGERHQGQYMVRHYHRVMETAAQHKVMVDMHEPVKDTGLRRTYPNLMTREGVRGQEYEAWSEGNPPSHTTILPFTRGLSGPIDFTPGIFDILFENTSTFRVHTTLAKQLALYVVLYSPLQMVADLPENYAGNPAFKFIEDVPTDWETTKVLHAKIGEYITTVRKDRNSNDWYLGSITNEEPRTLTLTLSFLEKGKKYVAEIYQDGKDAHVETNPLPLEISRQLVDSNTVFTLRLASGGGTAIRFSQMK